MDGIVLAVQATFVRGDFAYDWVTRYLADRNTWSGSRDLTVIVGDSLDAHVSCEVHTYGDEETGRPNALFVPRLELPVFVRWKGYWITVSANAKAIKLRFVPSTHAICLRHSSCSSRVWSRNRRVLEDFIQEARTYYFKCMKPPRRLFSLPDPVSDIPHILYHSRSWFV